MDLLGGRTPTGAAPTGGGPAPLGPPAVHVAVLDQGGTIVAADDRWAAAARDPESTIGALGSVGSRYHDACEAAARERPELRDHLLRLSGAVRAALAGDGDDSWGYAIGERRYAARVIPVRGADDHTLVQLADTTDYQGAAAAGEMRRRVVGLLDSLDVGVVLQDLEGRAITWNPCAERILGLGPGELSGTEPIDPRWAILHEDGWPLPPEARPARVALRSRTTVRNALVGVKHQDGSVTWTSMNAHPLTRGGDERPYAVAVSFRDVTESRRAHERESRSHNRFRSLIEHSSDVVTIVDDRGRVTYESPSVEAVLGYAPGELVGPGRLARVHPDDVGAALSVVTRLVGRPGESASCEYRIRARDESWRVLESVATNRLHDPAVLGIVINTRDVTERRETEAALRATTARLENLVQNLQAGVLVEDEAHRVAVVNAALCTALGIDTPPHELVGTGCRPLWRATASLAAEPERFADRIEELTRAREPVAAEEIALGDGRTFERDYIPIASGPAGGGHMWLYRDVSRRKGAEREAARLRDEAIRASRLKSEFLGTMSHEIRTPMNSVLATMELLLDTALAPHQRELAGIVRDAGYGLLSIVDDALDLSRIEAEKLEPREVALDLAAVVEGVGDVVLSSARAKGLALSVYVDPRIPPRLRGDAQWLRQVLVNLAGNAVKFTDAGDVRIRAELEGRGASEATVRLAVTDTGAGIPEGATDRLFEPFVQVDPGAARHGGTGLGLAICRRLVRLMGGEVEVESKPGSGSTFSFSLTLPAAPGGETHRAQAGTRALRVLIAEPRGPIAAIAGDYLAAWGVETQRAASAQGAGERAAAAARAGRPFDLALVGLGPPAAAARVASDLHATRGCEDMALVLLKDVGAPAVEAAGLFATELTRPLKQAQLYEAVVGGRAPDAAEAEPPAPPLPAGLRVLVAEDNLVNRELLVRQLARLGVTADVVASGREATAAVRARPYDAVLMDAHMPEVDGLEAARAIRSLAGARGATPIVAITADGTPGERGACLAAGMDDVVPKPISSSRLAGALRRVISAPDEVPPVDTAAIARLEADLCDRDELRRIAGIYLSQLASGAREAAAAAEAGDGGALRRSAHRLGSASATFGAGRVAELCHRLEALGASGQAAAAREPARALGAERDRADAELRRLLDL